MTHSSEGATGSPEDPSGDTSDWSSPTSPSFGDQDSPPESDRQPSAPATGDEIRYSANPDASDLYAAGSYGTGTGSAYPEQQHDAPQPGGQAYDGQSYGAPEYGTQQYGTQPYGAQPYGGQQYSGQQYEAQPFGAQQYGTQQYGAQQYGAMQPYGYVAPVARKDPGMMLLASFFIPGLGTILNGETNKGVGILVGYIVSCLLIVVLIGIPMVLGFWIWGIVDAYKGAQDFNARHGLP